MTSSGDLAHWAQREAQLRWPWLRMEEVLRRASRYSVMFPFLSPQDDGPREIVSESLRCGYLIGYGFVDRSGVRNLIVPEWWSVADIDWENGNSKIDDIDFRRVQFLEYSSLIPEVEFQVNRDLRAKGCFVEVRDHEQVYWETVAKLNNRTWDEEAWGRSESTEPVVVPEPGTSPSKRFSQVSVDEWYQRRVSTWPEGRRRPNRNEDWEAAKQDLGEHIPRSVIWNEGKTGARDRLAPADWSSRGRPKSV